MTDLLIIVAVALLLFACGGVFIHKARRGRPKPVKRPERLSVGEHKLTINEQMSRLLKPAGR